MTPVQRVVANITAAVLLAGYYYQTRIKDVPVDELPSSSASIMLLVLTILVAIVASIPTSGPPPPGEPEGTKKIKVAQAGVKDKSQ